ncbi:ABC transporter ATP-binding protein [Clostridium sp. B9]|uniref:ABC transporter ATP-binding protein n=1 Tax=Clostridium sp. B9 TaxID=3423224 RepID=UPI003D2ED854
MGIKLEKIEKSFRGNRLYKDFSIEFEDGKINCILGESGCGKTTLLNIISGLEDFDYGKVFGIESRISYVFQEDRLIEWKNVYENMEIPLRKIYNKEIRDKKIKKILERMGLIKNIKSFPKELSGGMRQRVNIARALLYEDRLLLMDEPFKSLDEKSKESVIEVFKEVQVKKKATTIIVTHDIKEAISLGDNLFILGDRPVNVLESFKDIKKLDEKSIGEKILCILKNKD